MLKDTGITERFYKCRNCGRVQLESSMSRLPMLTSQGYMKYKLRCGDVSCHSINIDPFEDEGVLG